MGNDANRILCSASNDDNDANAVYLCSTRFNPIICCTHGNNNANNNGCTHGNNNANNNGCTHCGIYTHGNINAKLSARLPAVLCNASTDIYTPTAIHKFCPPNNSGICTADNELNVHYSAAHDAADIYTTPTSCDANWKLCGSSAATNCTSFSQAIHCCHLAPQAKVFESKEEEEGLLLRGILY